MTSLRVGNAPCSWSILEFDESSKSQIEYGYMLDELVETGYTGTELGAWGYMPTDPERLKAELGKRSLVMLAGIACVALKDRDAHTAGVSNALTTARLLAAVATDPKPYLVLLDNNATVPERIANAGRITPELGLTPLQWRTFTEGANQIAHAVWEETGLRTAFHHHCAGYVETPEEITRFLELTDPELIGLVFDSAHYAYGAANCDVVQGLERFKERVWYIHCKDHQPQVANRARAEQWDYFQALRCGVFCELGNGSVDFPAMLRWLKSNHYDGYVLAEQDVLPGMGTPKESAGRNREYLRSIENMMEQR